MLKNKGFSGTCRVLSWFAALFLAASAPADEAALGAALRAAIPDIDINSIRESRLPGVYEVMFGTEVIYVSADGRYLIQGDLLDISERRNLSEDTRAGARLKLLDRIPSNETIEFAPPGAKHLIYVFTDISCGYCRRLHRDIAEINRLGIAVRYLAFPRNGETSPSFHDMESVWCAPDRRSAITEAKQGRPVEQRHCDNPVQRQYQLGQTLGVHGTPAIFRSDGRLISGYMPPRELLEAIKEP